jgi:hypothetical protein
LFFADPRAAKNTAGQMAPQPAPQQPAPQHAGTQPPAPHQVAPQPPPAQQATPEQAAPQLQPPQQAPPQQPASWQAAPPPLHQQPPVLGQPQRQTRPGRPQPTRKPDKELRQRAIASLVLGALAMVALLGLSSDLRRGLYLLLFSALIGIGSCVIGITAVRKARKTGSFRPRGAIGGIVLGALAALVSIPILVTYLAYPTQVTNYVNCLSNAQNSSAQQACMNRFYKSIHVGMPALHNDVAGTQGRADGPRGRGRRPREASPSSSAHRFT